MRLIAITQRVDIIANYQERRDALDQNWIKLMHHAGLSALVLPNNLAAAKILLNTLNIDGVIFSGGNDLLSCGGNAPERDEMEIWLLNHCQQNNLPVFGVCRGMQLIQQTLGTQLYEVTGHICARQEICINGIQEYVNSYHRWGSVDATDDCDVFAYSSDNVVKGIRHKSRPITGIMWHPERIEPLRSQDIHLLKSTFTI